jgi:hypothetical protein
MVGAMTATAGGQKCVVSIDGGRKRCQTEEQDEQNGESAPHLAYILHELWNPPRFGQACGLQVSSMHLEFPYPDRKVQCRLK